MYISFGIPIFRIRHILEKLLIRNSGSKATTLRSGASILNRTALERGGTNRGNSTEFSYSRFSGFILKCKVSGMNSFIRVFRRTDARVLRGCCIAENGTVRSMIGYVTGTRFDTCCVSDFAITKRIPKMKTKAFVLAVKYGHRKNSEIFGLHVSVRILNFFRWNDSRYRYE